MQGLSQPFVLHQGEPPLSPNCSGYLVQFPYAVSPDVLRPVQIANVTTQHSIAMGVGRSLRATNLGSRGTGGVFVLP